MDISTRETVIVVEDSRPNRNILVSLLKKLGYDVLEAVDGSVALELIDDLGYQPNRRLVAVLSDIMMPRTDGLALLRKIRKNDKFKNLPVIFITAMADRETLLNAQDLHVNGYLLKPVSLARIIKMLSELFPEKTFSVDSCAL